MRFEVFTLFPECFTGSLQESILKRAIERGILEVHIHNIRDYAADRHRVCDDYPYGGGAGMVMKPEPVFAAVEAVMDTREVPIILMSPQGRLFSDTVAHELAQHSRIALICGHYEGVDERVRQGLANDEISIGDYVLTGGEIPSLVMIDAVTRLLPGALGDETSAECESHASGLLEHPHYTRPAEFRNWKVPEVLLSGHHAEIEKWRRRESLRRTLERRPDLLPRASLSEEDRQLLETLKGDR